MSRDIRNDLPAIKGFSERNLKRMIRFYREYPGLVEKVPQAAALLTDRSVLEKLQKLVAKIPWGQNFLLIEKVKDLSTRLWYMQKTIEKDGTGTLDMITCCREASLPEPDFEQRAGQWVVTIWRDWLTEMVMGKLGLRDRERRIVSLLKARGRIGNKEYQEEFGVSKPTASRHLEALADRGVLTKIGTTGKGTYYVLSRKGLTKGSKDS